MQKLSGYMKYLFLLVALFALSACSQTHLETAWTRTKDASFSAITDPVTWAPALTGAALYVTQTDDRLTNYCIEHPILDAKNVDLYRDINGIETYVSAVFIDDNSSLTKVKRVVVESTGFLAAQMSTNILNTTIQKDYPSKTGKEAIGSHHANDTFAGSSMNRRNVAQLDIPTWGKYSLNTVSYFTASASAYIQIQEGIHSVGDQLINASIGNFIGLFVHDVFMKEDTHIKLSIQKEASFVSLNWNF